MHQTIYPVKRSGYLNKQLRDSDREQHPRHALGSVDLKLRQSLRPGEVKEWPLDGRKAVNVRGALWGEASRLGLQIQTDVDVERGVVWVARPPEDEPPPPAPEKRY